MGRLRSEASPSKVAVIGWLPATPIIRRDPVPALPKSSVADGATSPPMPTPTICQRPGRLARDRRRQAPGRPAAVRSTSSPSRRPSTRVSPIESSPKIMERCEIDLSPGTRMRPCRGVPGLLETGDAERDRATFSVPSSVRPPGGS